MRMEEATGHHKGPERNAAVTAATKGGWGHYCIVLAQRFGHQAPSQTKPSLSEVTALAT